jgi:uncharacterized protein (DUF1499 family)
MFKLSGKRPASPGSKNGKLAPVVKKPNNVSSQANVNDRAHYVAPLKFNGEAGVAFQKLLKLVQSQPRAIVVTQDGQSHHRSRNFETCIIISVACYFGCNRP